MNTARRRQYINRLKREQAKKTGRRRNMQISGRGTAVKERHPYLFFIAAVCIVLITAIMAGNRAKAVSPEAEGYYKYYTSVSVEYGDTLEQLAVRYNNRGVKTDSEYISEVCRINDLDDRDDIKSGCSLILPYYSDTFIR